MKVLLTTLNSKFIHTNLAIRYIREYSRYLESEKYKVFLKEYTINNSIDFIMKDIVKLDVDVIVFSVYIWNIEDIRNICENLKKISPNIKICLGGPEVSYDYNYAMENYDFIDYILYGEGEVVYHDLIQSFIGDRRIEDVKGICYKDCHSNIVVNEPMPLICNLDDIPSPYDNIDKEEYENKIVYFESSRGCPFNCQYCLSSAIKGLRYFSVDRIKRDLKNLIDVGVAQVKFIDRTFNANREIAKDIMKFLMDNDNGYTTYHFEVTAHLIDDEMLDFLKDCKPGLFQFEIGVQSTNESTLVEVGRTDDFKRLSKVVTTVARYNNIHQHLDLIAGLPFENFERFGKSFDDVYSLRPECLQLGFLKMIKGTGIRDRADVHGYKFKDYPPYEILSNNYLSYKEIIRLKDIEEILETYYNSGNFSLSIEYIVSRFYERPFEFYNEFSRYFDENGYFDVSNGKNRLYEIFLEFFENKVAYNLSKDKNFNKSKEIEVDIFKEILKFDFVSLGKSSSIPSFFNRFELDDYKNRCHQFLKDEENQKNYTPNQFGQPAKNIIKYTQFEEFKYNVLDLKKDIFTEIKNEQNTILFYYDIDKIFDKSIRYNVVI